MILAGNADTSKASNAETIETIEDFAETAQTQTPPEEKEPLDPNPEATPSNYKEYSPNQSSVQGILI